jgi:eukaryotic-like serine/threonine-protein kinase
MNNRAPELPWTIPSPGETFAGKYVVDGVCGRGGLAVVLSAMHPGLGQRVAIKMLLPEWASDFDVVERFLREGRAATRIKSQHVVRVFDVGTLENGAPYLVLEYLEGHNLDEVVAMWGPLQASTAIDWVLQACEAISEAHALGIIHRDLKPGNLFLTRLADGSPCIKVIDFGLSKLAAAFMPEGSAKLTRPNDVMGSPHYMAPEQLRAMQDADARTDLWALGVVLFELIAGQTPFRGESMAELCAAVLTRPPEPLSSLCPGVPPAVEAAVHRCLSKDPVQRFTSAAELARALAPYGTPLSRASCMRIERVLEGRASDAPTDAQEDAEVDEWPSAVFAGLPGTHTSAKVILGSLLMLAGIGVGVFMWMYDAVHGSEPERVDALAVHPAAPPPPVTHPQLVPLPPPLPVPLDVPTASAPKKPPPEPVPPRIRRQAAPHTSAVPDAGGEHSYPAALAPRPAQATRGAAESVSDPFHARATAPAAATKASPEDDPFLAK